MKVLDLFSGIGGFSLGLERAGMRTVGFCEIDPYCRAVLRKHWPDVPIHADVRTLGRIGGVDLVCGGFPCQPFSHAGKQLGAADDRHLWPAMLEVIKRERPTWVIGENVVGIIAMELDAVLADLEAIGYACQTFDIPAGAVGAPHIRRRVWIVACDRDRDRESACAVNEEMEGMLSSCANAQGDGRQQGGASEGKGLWKPGGVCDATDDAAHSDRARLEGGGASSDAQGRQEPDGHAGLAGGIGGAWEIEPDVGRVAHGIPNRVHRLRALGNSVVPQVVEIIGRSIMRAERG